MNASPARRLLLFLLAAALAGCAARVPPRPGGIPVADPTAAATFEAATKGCRGLRTMTGELALSGRAGAEKVRGRLIAGLAAPASIRLEAVAPFGPPVFILAARDDRGTLLFPRDDRVLPEAAVADVLARLTGLSLGAPDLRAVLTGCVGAGDAVVGGRAWPDGWKAVTFDEARTVYLRQLRGQWVVVAADTGRWRVDYAEHLNGWPRQVRVRTAESADVDLTARLAQLEINVPLGDEAFEVEIPSDAERITLDDLRAVAPLRATSP